MNKPIIIDGVDVSECEFYEPKAQVMQCHRGAITQRCKENNCHFKQLKRLKAENEELKEEYNKYNSFCAEANAQISELTQIIFSTYRLLIRDFDNLKGKILAEKDMEYIEKRNQSISQCLKQLNEVLKDV